MIMIFFIYDFSVKLIFTTFYKGHEQTKTTFVWNLVQREERRLIYE